MTYDGEFLCIVGPTGCGKTTFLNSLTHLYEPTAGNILLDGEEIDLRKHNIAYIFQEYSAMEWLTVRENVRFGLDIKRDYKNIDEKVNNALDLVGLTPFADYYPKQLSASMLQRVVIARAFATQPDLLLMDEPYGQLDINLRFKLEDEVIRLCKQTKTTVLFITHNIEEATYLASICRQVYMIVRKPYLRASKAMQHRVMNTPNIEVLFEYNTAEVLGDDTGVTGVTIRHNDGKERTLAVAGFFVAIGHHPNTELFRNQLELDAEGYIRTEGNSSKTSVEGVFAAGDVQDPAYRQAITAAGSGCIAALDCERFLLQ